MLREVAGADITARVERLVESGAERELAPINAFAVARAHKLDDERTIGAFLHVDVSTPDRALVAALRMREAIREAGRQMRQEDLLLTIGVNDGPFLADMLNDVLDYFGQTVNIATRVQGLAVSRAIFATKLIVERPPSSALLQSAGVTLSPRSAALKLPAKWWSTKSPEQSIPLAALNTTSFGAAASG